MRWTMGSMTDPRIGFWVYSSTPAPVDYVIRGDPSHWIPLPRPPAHLQLRPNPGSQVAQDVAIGRMVLERADAKRQCGLLYAQISEWSHRTKQLGEGSGADGLKIVDWMIAAGGMDRLKQIFTECDVLNQRLEEIAKSMKDAGVE